MLQIMNLPALSLFVGPARTQHDGGLLLFVSSLSYPAHRAA